MTLGVQRREALAPATSKATATDYFSTDITPIHANSVFRITVAIGTAVKFGVVVNGGTFLPFNNDVNLTADSIYTFTMEVGQNLGGTDVTYNFQHTGATADVEYFSVSEVSGGVI